MRVPLDGSAAWRKRERERELILYNNDDDDGEGKNGYRGPCVTLDSSNGVGPFYPVV